MIEKLEFDAENVRWRVAGEDLLYTQSAIRDVAVDAQTCRVLLLTGAFPSVALVVLDENAKLIGQVPAPVGVILQYFRLRNGSKVQVVGTPTDEVGNALDVAFDIDLSQMALIKRGKTN